MPELEVLLPPDTESPGRARRLVKKVLARDRDDLVDIATLLVSEVVTNAVLHAATDLQMRVGRTGGTLRVEVTDSSPLLPVRRSYSPDAGTGRGLVLIDELADAWGQRPCEGGKVVWFELATTPA